MTYKVEAFYAGVHDWTQTTLEIRHLSVAISSNMRSSLPPFLSSVFLNDVIFASDGIDMLSLLLTHLNTSSIKNILLSISEHTCLEIGLGELSIDYVLIVQGIPQRMHRITMERIIPIFAIASINRNRYPGVKILYLASDAILVNCGLLELSGLLSNEETRQCALVISSVPL